MEDNGNLGASASKEVQVKSEPKPLVSILKRKIVPLHLRPTYREKMFRKEWMEMDIMKHWLVPMTNASKAKCIACNKVLKAGKSELIKHASGIRHEQNLEQLLQGGTGFTANESTQALVDPIPKNLGARKQASSTRYVVTHKGPQIGPTLAEADTQTGHTGPEAVQQIFREKQLEFLSRIATAVERIADIQEVKVQLMSEKQVDQELQEMQDEDPEIHSRQ